MLAHNRRCVMDEMKQRAVKHVVGLHPHIRENDSHHHHRKKTDDAHVESAKINAHQKQHHPFLFDSAQAVLQKTAVQYFFTDGRCQRNDKAARRNRKGPPYCCPWIPRGLRIPAGKSIPSEGKGQAHRGTSHTTSEWFRGFRLHPAFLMGTLLLTVI